MVPGVRYLLHEQLDLEHIREAMSYSVQSNQRGRHHLWRGHLSVVYMLRRYRFQHIQWLILQEGLRQKRHGLGMSSLGAWAPLGLHHTSTDQSRPTLPGWKSGGLLFCLVRSHCCTHYSGVCQQLGMQ